MRKILVVEDEKIVAFDIKKILSTLKNINVSIVTSGNQALMVVDRETPDLILMDINLNGEMDGIQTAERLNQKYQIPVIYLTAFADDGTLQRATKTQPAGYIFKPFNEVELKTNVEIALYKNELLKKSRDQELVLSRILAKAGLGIIKTLTDGRVLWMNDVAQKICAVSAEALHGKNLFDFITLCAEKTKAEIRKEELADKQELVCEMRNTNGVVLPLRITMQSVDETDEMPARVYIFEDLTEKRLAEKTIRSAQNLIEETFAILQDALVIMDNDFNIIDCNPATEKIFGISRALLINRSVSLIMAGDRLDSVPGMPFADVLHQGSFLKRHEMEITRPSGEKYPVEYTLARLSDENRQQSGWVLFVSDNSERKKYEQKLREAKEQAEAANRAKSEFIANMSHELRTPLNSIIGMTDLTLDTELTRDQRESLEIVRQSSYSFLQLLNAILDFSKIETGKIELEETEFNLFNLVKDTMNVLKIQAKKKGVYLETVIDEAIPTFLIGDPFRLNQIIVNLVGNAIKFTESGEIKLSLSASADQDSQTTITFSVQDTGIGIPDDKLDMIFESFQQLDGSTTRKYGGTGLGLAITKRLVELMGGAISVTSVENEGSIFSFSIRFAQGKGVSAHKKSRQKKIRSRKNLSQLKVLVAEDDQVARKMIQRVLEKRGHTVFCVSDGRAAIEILSNVRFDVVLMDIEMPVLDGLEATKIIRSMHQNPEISKIPIIAMTAHARREDRDLCIKMGMNHYISKPIDLMELVTIIESYEIIKTSPALIFSNDERLVIDYPALFSYRKVLENEKRIPYNFIEEELKRHERILCGACETGAHDLLEKEADQLQVFAGKTGAVGVREEAFRLKMAARKKTLATAKQVLVRLEGEITRFLYELALAPQSMKKGDQE